MFQPPSLLFYTYANCLKRTKGRIAVQSLYYRLQCVPDSNNPHVEVVIGSVLSHNINVLLCNCLSGVGMKFSCWWFHGVQAESVVVMHVDHTAGALKRLSSSERSWTVKPLWCNSSQTKQALQNDRLEYDSGSQTLQNEYLCY